MPQLKFAELIDGVVYMPSPVSYEDGRRDVQMQLLVATYAARTGICEVLSNATWLMLESAPQPDIAVRLLPEYGGKTSISADGLASGSPELVVEITRSSRSFDLGPKLALYQRAAVQEYIAVLTEERRIEWHVLESGSYGTLQPDADDLLQSLAFPGLRLDESAFWRDDSTRLLAVLEAGLAAAECGAFLERLRHTRGAH
jgi:Uma2 family endonuclease